jgi:predicted nucleic acid-binding protein
VSGPFVDTNVIIRLVSADDPDKQVAAARFFQSVRDGQLTIAAPVTVIADAVYVLSSPRLYHLDRGTIADALTTLVRLPHFQVDQQVAVLAALQLYKSAGLTFDDAMIVAAMRERGATELYSYDTGFDRVPGIARRQP